MEQKKPLNDLKKLAESSTVGSHIKNTPLWSHNILARMLAFHYDSLYKDHISKAKELWYFDILSGKICKVPDENMKLISKNEYQAYAFFRTKEDIIKVATVLRDIRRAAFRKKKKKNGK